MPLPHHLRAVQPFLADPFADLAGLARALEGVEQAEAEVARAWIAHRARPELLRRLRSADATARRRATRFLRYVDVSTRATLLRWMVRDPNQYVRNAARSLLYSEPPDEVALPDARFDGSKVGPSPFHLGGWNASGWSAGLSLNGRMHTRCTLSSRRVARPEPPEVAELRAAERGGLPELQTREDVLEWLDLSPDDLRAFCSPGAYVEFSVPKTNGGFRTLAAPRAVLKEVQRRIHDELLAQLPVHAACHAYARGRSLVSNAIPHVGAAVVLKTDLRDFFPSIHFLRVSGLLRHYGLGPGAASTLARLTTYRSRERLASQLGATWGVLPQGAPTSPGIANLICRQLDARLTGLARAFGARYTRYADDLTLSFAEPFDGRLGRLFWWIDQIAAQEGFFERKDKRRVLRPHQPQRVTGVCVNAKVSISRQRRRRFRALLHHLETRGQDAEGRTKAELREHVFGTAAYFAMVQPELRDRLAEQLGRIYGTRPTGS